MMGRPCNKKLGTAPSYFAPPDSPCYGFDATDSKKPARGSKHVGASRYMLLAMQPPSKQYVRAPASMEADHD